MRTCKIILIILLIIKSILIIVKAILEDDDKEQLIGIVRVLFTLPLTWGLYWGAGLLDF